MAHTWVPGVLGVLSGGLDRSDARGARGVEDDVGALMVEVERFRSPQADVLEAFREVAADVGREDLGCRGSRPSHRSRIQLASLE